MLLTPRDKAIILTVYTHGRLRREQVRRLFFRKAGPAGTMSGQGLASAQATSARLRQLARAGFLLRVRPPAARGSTQYLYSLGPLGTRLLSSEYGITTSSPSQRALTRSFLALNHTLEVADFFIALKERLETAGGTVLTWLGERQAAHRFHHQGRRRMIAPDAYCLWSLHGQEGSFFLEWERGHQGLDVIAQKLDGYDAYYAHRGYLEHLGEVGLTPRLAFVVPDKRRQTQLLGWLLRQQGRARWRFLPTLLVGAREPVLTNPLGCTWLKPGGVHQTRLLNGQ